MPENAPEVKRAAVQGYGGQITLCKPTLSARETTLEAVVAETGAEVIHPYNDYRVIAGQGTAALELLTEVPDLDVIMAPVGGGGLLSGTALAAHGIRPALRVIAAEPEQADDAFQSLRAGHLIPSVDPTTIADGLRTSLGDRTFPIIKREVERIVTVSEDSIVSTMRFMWERTKLLVEPSACVPVAALFDAKTDFSGLRIGVILSGGNLPW
jgi:threonine dehydratase